MIKESKVTKYGEVKLPDTFLPTIMEINENNAKKVNVYFGKRMDILVVTGKDSKLSDEDFRLIETIINDE